MEFERGLVMGDKDPDFIEQEAHKDYQRQQLLIHILNQQNVLLLSMQSLIQLPEECALFANLFEQAAQSLRQQQAQSKTVR